jgi:hypothetical protein
MLLLDQCTGHDINNIPSQDRKTWMSGPFPNPNKEEHIMREVLKFFKNYNQDQPNRGRKNEDIVQEFLQLLKESIQLVNCWICLIY